MKVVAKKEEETQPILEFHEALNKKFREIKEKAPPCIGACNASCYVVPGTDTQVKHFYLQNVS